MSNLIKVTVRQAYGQDRIYPVCDKAKLFASLIGGKILSAQDLKLIKQLGFEIEFVPKVVILPNESMDE